MTDIVLLTKSTMKGDYCIAGLDTSFGEWVRLVSDADGSPLLAIHRQYQNVPDECKPLDVVSAELLERVPKRNQTENRRVKADTMHKLGTIPYYSFSAGLGNAYLVVSMAINPDRRSGRYHKFIAKIFPHR